MTPLTGFLTDLVPPPTQAITSVAEFQKLLEFVQRRLRNGILKQCSTGRPGLPQDEILHLSLSGPWPDVIEADFVDVHGQPYHLFVDCYHGTGVWHDPSAAEPHRSRTTSMLGSSCEELRHWEFRVMEVSAGAYRATGTDRVGHRVVTEGVDPDTCLEECRSAALMLLRGKQDDSSSLESD